MERGSHLVLGRGLRHLRHLQSAPDGWVWIWLSKRSGVKTASRQYCGLSITGWKWKIEHFLYAPNKKICISNLLIALCVFLPRPSFRYSFFNRVLRVICASEYSLVYFCVCVEKKRHFHMKERQLFLQVNLKASLYKADFQLEMLKFPVWFVQLLFFAIFTCGFLRRMPAMPSGDFIRMCLCMGRVQPLLP